MVRSGVSPTTLHSSLDNKCSYVACSVCFAQWTEIKKECPNCKEPFEVVVLTQSVSLTRVAQNVEEMIQSLKTAKRGLVELAANLSEIAQGIKPPSPPLAASSSSAVAASSSSAVNDTNRERELIRQIYRWYAKSQLTELSCKFDTSPVSQKKYKFCTTIINNFLNRLQFNSSCGYIDACHKSILLKSLGYTVKPECLKKLKEDQFSNPNGIQEIFEALVEILTMRINELESNWINNMLAVENIYACQNLVSNCRNS